MNNIPDLNIFRNLLRAGVTATVVGGCHVTTQNMKPSSEMIQETASVGAGHVTTQDVELPEVEFPKETTRRIVRYIPPYYLRNMKLGGLLGVYATESMAEAYAARYFPEGNCRTDVDYYALCEKFIREKNEAGIQALLKHEKSPISIFHSAVLHNAVRHGSSAVISLLIHNKNKVIPIPNKYNKVDIDREDINGNTPLHLAVLNMDESKVSLLLKRGASINRQNVEGRTPLHLSVMNGVASKPITLLLLDHHAEIDSRDGNDATPLHLAQGKDTISLLIERGADVNLQDANGYTRLHLDIRTGIALGIAQMLLHVPGIGCDIRNLKNETVAMLIQDTPLKSFYNSLGK